MVSFHCSFHIESTFAVAALPRMVRGDVDGVVVVRGGQCPDARTESREAPTRVVERHSPATDRQETNA